MNISIIIPNYNGCHFLENCIKALLKQTLQPSEIIIVDNGSTDSSANWLRENHPTIRLIILDKNYGFSRAVNEGIKAAKSKYVALLNNDTEVMPNWLKALSKPMLENAQIFSCSSKMLQYHNRSLIDDAGDQYNIMGWAYKRGDNMLISNYSKDSIVFSACAGAALYNKTILDEIGYFDESFFAYLEDVDLGFRALRHGYINYYCSDAIVYHVGSGTSGSKYNDFKVKLAARNNVLVVAKNMNLYMMIFNFPFLLLGSLLKLLFFVRKGYGKLYLRGFMEGIRANKRVIIPKCNYKSLSIALKIEILMIKNTFDYIIQKIKIRM